MEMAPPTNIKEVQNLNGKVVSLNRFHIVILKIYGHRRTWESRKVEDETAQNI